MFSVLKKKKNIARVDNKKSNLTDKKITNKMSTTRHPESANYNLNLEHGGMTNGLYTRRAFEIVFKLRVKKH